MAALQAQWTAFRLAEAGEAAPAPGAAALAESGAAAAAVGGGMYADRSGEISKQKKKALAREAREAEAERALAAEAAALPDKRALEFAALAAKLAAQVAFEGSFAGCAPRIKEVRADGHCMFRAIADQLALHAADDDGDASAATRLRDAAALRTAAVEHMRAHRDDFAPFLISADGDPVGTQTHFRAIAFVSCFIGFKTILRFSTFWINLPTCFYFAFSLFILCSHNTLHMNYSDSHHISALHSLRCRHA